MTPMLRSQVIASLAMLGLSGHASMGQDRPPGPDVAARVAEADYLRARLARVEPEIALETYVGTTPPERDAAAEARVALARTDLDRARYLFAWDEWMVEQGWSLPSDKLRARLKLEQGKFSPPDNGIGLWPRLARSTPSKYVTTWSELTRRLMLDKAKYDLEMAETVQATLKRYLKEKTTKELRSAVEKAAALEAISWTAYDKARAKPAD